MASSERVWRAYFLRTTAITHHKMSQTTQRRTLCYRLLSYGDFMVRQDCEVSLEIALWYVAMRVRLCTLRIDFCRLWIRRSCTKTRPMSKTTPTSKSPYLGSLYRSWYLYFIKLIINMASPFYGPVECCGLLIDAFWWKEVESETFKR